MTHEWVETKNVEYKQKTQKFFDDIINELFNIFDKTDYGYFFIKYIQMSKQLNEPIEPFVYLSLSTQLELKQMNIKWKHQESDKEKEELTDEENTNIAKYKEYAEKCHQCYDYMMNERTKHGHVYDWLKDSQILTFLNDDIIITDPCYLDLSDEDLDKLAEGKYAESSTIYGDWSCTTFDSDSKQPIGHFCADGGMVCVACLSDVLKLNPNFNYHIEKDWTTTWIKGFSGVVQIKIKQNGDDDFECYVEGHGKDANGNRLNFITKQTGL